ncbi:archaeal type cofactor-independent phosphoglycerate mutase [Micractinium conductrix]|uniref:Archaeal type cofactor-independent phosphoglycerate mutase n=1 Tax=Micractinium conductrix TaxID=554055 RepID=A0A2P6V8J6_9CHLO|nr:archaeal type cofactor-independent phosphoglycerate mutase [Micractinium conductrix]|eukprot:PSC70414.1 archaeal type cofactor-independent phosphoglycerate mutase [Micractinium conductrix]
MAAGAAREPERVAFVLIDGVGDVTVPALGGRTPLQAAALPHLDAVAAAGLTGLMDPVEPGLACGSDTAHLSLFGYDPRTYYRGRGAFESMGAGLDMAPGDIAFKSNFATLDPASGIVLRRRADRRFEDLGPVLCAALDGMRLPSFPQHTVSVKYATEHRCGVVVRGTGLNDAIGGTDPLKDNLPLLRAEPLDGSPQAAHTAAVVNEVSDCIRQVLEGHAVNAQRVAEGKPPANVVLLRGCGCRLALQEFHERHGLRACMVAPTKIIAGLGMSLGVYVLDVPGTTGDYRTLFHKKAEAIAEALATGGYQFAFLHVKAVDDTGHDFMVQMKPRYQEVVDRMVGQLLRLLWSHERAGNGRYSVVVTGDHSTPVEFGDHSHEPVPFAIAHLRHVVEAMGGDAAVQSIPLGGIPHPGEEGNGTAAGQAAEAAAGQAGGVEERQQQQQQQQQEGPPAAASQQYQQGPSAAAFRQQQQQHGGPPPASQQQQDEQQQQPQARWPSAVASFDEIAVAAGPLGRFPGSQVMPLVRQFIGLEAVG